MSDLPGTSSGFYQRESCSVVVGHKMLHLKPFAVMIMQAGRMFLKMLTQI